MNPGVVGLNFHIFQPYYLSFTVRGLKIFYNVFWDNLTENLPFPAVNSEPLKLSIAYSIE